MESQKQTSFTFEIDNFSEKKASIRSPKFLSGGCEWYVKVRPKGHIVDDHLALCLFVANPKSLRLGWKKRASFSFFLLDQSGEEHFKTEESCGLFCAQMKGWGFPKTLPLKKLQEKGCLEKNKLIVKVEVKVVDEADVTGKETLDIRGFQVLYPQAVSVGRLFIDHPDIAVNVRQKNQFLKTTYMNILLGLIETLNKPPHDISETELSNAGSELSDLTEAGFKLDWLKAKLDEVSLEKKKSNVPVQELEEHIKNLTLELNKEKGKNDTCAAKVLSLEKEKRESAGKFLSLELTVSDLRDELKKERHKSYSYVAKVILLEETVLNLKDKLNKDKGKSDTSAAKVLSLEQTVSDLEDEVSDLKHEVSYLENELNKEKGKSDTSAAKVLSLEQTVSDLEHEVSDLKHEVSDLKDEVLDLKDELNKEKDESDTFAAKVLSLEQTMSDLEDVLNKEKGKSDSSAAKVLSLEQTVSDLEDELNKEKGKSDTCAAKVLSLEQTVLNLKDELNKKEVESATCAAKVCSLEQTVLNLKAELNKEKAAACSWEVLDYEDFHHEK